MFQDIVFPTGNEKEFISVASGLGTGSLLFIYDFERKEDSRKPIELQKETDIKLDFGLLCLEKDIFKARNYSKNLFIKAKDENRFIFEKFSNGNIFGLEEVARFDKLHYRASGLNQVLCKLAAENNISLCLSFSSILNSNESRRSVIIGRMTQNIKFCRKYKVNLRFASFAKEPFEMRAENDLKAFFRMIGIY